MKNVVFPLIALLALVSCGGEITEKEKEQMSINARMQLEELYHEEGITPYGMVCKLANMELENDTVARGNISISFEDWSKKPAPKVNIQAMVKFVKLHNVAWRLRPRSVDVFLVSSLIGTQSKADSTYILKTFMTEDDYE